jgi:hypothetical protein
MHVRTFTTLRSFGKLVAPALTVWLSGLACLLTCAAVCYGAEASGCKTEMEGSHGEAHSCCTAREARHERSEADSAAMDVREDESEADGCCFSTARPTMTAPLPVPIVVADALPASEFAPPVPDAVAAPRAVAVVPAVSRGDTYLRCCVLLI